MTTPHTHIPKNIHHIVTWMAAVMSRRGPDGEHIDRIHWYSESADLPLVYRERVSTWLARTEFAGVPPQLLAELPDEPGTGLYHLSAPCITARAERRAQRRTQAITVHVVARRSDYRRAIELGVAGVNPGLMHAIVAVVHRPKCDQERLGQPPTREPSEPFDDARDTPNGGDQR